MLLHCQLYICYYSLSFVLAVIFIIQNIKQVESEKFRGEKYHFIYNRIRYLAGVTSGITCVIKDNYAKIKIDSCYFCP